MLRMTLARDFTSEGEEIGRWLEEWDQESVLSGRSGWDAQERRRGLRSEAFAGLRGTRRTALSRAPAPTGLFSRPDAASLLSLAAGSLLNLFIFYCFNFNN